MIQKAQLLGVVVNVDMLDAAKIHLDLIRSDQRLNRVPVIFVGIDMNGEDMASQGPVAVLNSSSYWKTLNFEQEEGLKKNVL